MLLVTLLAGRWAIINNRLPLMGLIIAIAVMLIPLQLGWLLFQAKRKSDTYDIKSVVHFRKKVPAWQFILLVLGIFLWMGFIFFVVGPLPDSYFMQNWFSWMPEWLQIGGVPSSMVGFDRAELITVGILMLIFNGFAGPIIEELYFRGYLLPRMQRFGALAPLLNAVLFSLYHFFSPWQNLTRTLALIPFVYVVWWKRNIYIGMAAHVMGNVFSSIGLLVFLMNG